MTWHHHQIKKKKKNFKSTWRIFFLNYDAIKTAECDVIWREMLKDFSERQKVKKKNILPSTKNVTNCLSHRRKFGSFCGIVDLCSKGWLTREQEIEEQEWAIPQFRIRPSSHYYMFRTMWPSIHFTTGSLLFFGFVLSKEVKLRLILPNFFAEQKVAGPRCLAKKFPFNFTNI